MAGTDTKKKATGSHKQEIKSCRKVAKRTIANRAVKTGLKNISKKIRNNGDPALIKDAYRKADSAFAKGKISKNKANRIKSRLAIAANKNAAKKEAK
jgi:small subunit ribosomal protein S20